MGMSGGRDVDVDAASLEKGPRPKCLWRCMLTQACLSLSWIFLSCLSRYVLDMLAGHIESKGRCIRCDSFELTLSALRVYIYMCWVLYSGQMDAMPSHSSTSQPGAILD